MKIILIGNYLPDRQRSMLQFARMLERGFEASGVESVIWHPPVLFGRGWPNTLSGVGKWMGYLDKWLVFPLVLRWRISRLGSLDRFHICDHSNAPYLSHLPANRTAITCHDVLAIRGALGHQDAFCPASPTGTLLQQWILGGLSRAHKLATVSQATLDQLRDLTPASTGKDTEWRVIHNAFNESFFPVNGHPTTELLARLGLTPDLPYILHVGSALPRKNRPMLLNMVAELGNRWHGRICFAGQPLDETLRQQAHSLGLESRIVSVTAPDHATLLALYSRCQAFVFPSFSEGFGWPIIEAQACGAPVITSTLAPMPEVSGGAALHANPNRPDEFAEALLSLSDETHRQRLIRDGLANCARYHPDRMIESYLNLHRSTPNCHDSETHHRAASLAA